MMAPLFPNGNNEVMRLTTMVDQWMVMPPTTMEEIVPLISSPVVIVIITITLGFITPLIEEFGKTLIMCAMRIWQRPGLTQSFVWGAACGLGFALVEGVGNGALGLGDVGGWLGGAGARSLATAMHMLASGLMGLGWGMLWQKRWWGLPLSYVAAVVFHGL
jgi:RsiW-degrading membrane proteinase PrsW (M82 family)